jgi:alanine-synthesizing transaminase
MEDFYAIRRLPPYVFAQVKEMVAEAERHGRDVIDLSMGSPDLGAPAAVTERLREAALRKDSHRYSVSKGITALREAQARYYERRFGVRLNPETEVVHTLGSKNAFANLAFAITSPGDVVLAPNPSYPIHMFGFVMAGGVVRPIPCRADEEVFRAADRALRYCVPRPIAMVLNYPSNPTAETATLDFYREAVAYARKHDLILLSDLAYAEIYYDAPPPSILEVPGAKDVAIEFTSASKSFSMAGWRVGFAVGNERLIAALTRVKAYLDYGSFEPIQEAAIVALDDAEAITAEVRATYARRLGVLTESLAEAGWSVPRPEASMFVWAPLPEGQGGDSLAFAKRMVKEAGVALSPGTGFGEGGEGHVRIALVADEDRLREAARRLGAALEGRRAAA